MTFNRVIKSGVTPLKGVSSMGNCYEMKAVFSETGGQPCGFYLCEGDGRRLIVNYDPASGRLTIDRTNTADTYIPKFSRVASAQIAPEGSDSVALDIFVDRSTVEIFANGGEQVFTLLTYAGMDQTGVSTYTLAPSCRLAVDAWRMKSIH